MRLALLSDVHANLPALEAVLADLARRQVDATYHLGDLVGYAPWPDEVVARLAQAGIPGVQGNYDSTVGHAHKHCGCRYEDPEQEAQSHASFAWTLAHTSDATKAALRALPFRLDVRTGGGHDASATVILVHGTPTLNTLYWTEDRPDDFCRQMIARAGARPGDVLAFGHTHLPWHRVVDGVMLVNTGSVGRPKDGDPRAGYALLTVGSGAPTVEQVRVTYDVAAAAEAIRKTDLPDAFAEFLKQGGRRKK